MKLLLCKVVLIFIALNFNEVVNAQKIIQERSETTAQLIDDEKGVASATANIEYLVRRKDNQVMFSLSYIQVAVNADAGYYYKGKKYSKEVPGLIEQLSTLSGSYPKVNFDIYYGNTKQGSFSFSISAHNDLRILSTDDYFFNTTSDLLDKPNWSLVATGLESFSYAPNVLAYIQLNDLIIAYESDKKQKDDYTTLLTTADELYQSKNFTEAEAAYLKAIKHPLSNSYPTAQLKIVRAEMAQTQKEESYSNNMQKAAQAEQDKDYALALTYFSAALNTGVDNYRAETGSNRVRQTLIDIKTKQEQALKEKEEADKQKNEALLKEKENNATEADKIIMEKEAMLEKQNEEELNKLKEDLTKEDRKKVEDQLKQNREEAIAQKKKNEEAEKELVKKEKADRRKADRSLIDYYEENMAFDPVLYEKYSELGDEYFDKGNAIDPYEALKLDNKWWDTNPYMGSFRDDMNEPRRKEASEKSMMLLYDIQANFDIAKDHYMQAIKYTDPNSRQHKYLLSRVETMNMMLDFEKERITQGIKNEQQRQANYFKAKENLIAAQLQNNQVKGILLYSNITRGSKYGTWNGDKAVDQAVQDQKDYEKRANQADKQLKQDQLVTGVTTQIAMDATLDASKTTQLYDRNDVGINVYALSGYGGIPIVANDIPKSGYVSETFVETVTAAPFQCGFDLWLHRGKIWDLAINGDFMIGVLPIKGYNNNVVNYGSNVKLNIGYSRLKLAFEGDYHKRSANYEYDQDVALAELGNPYQQATNRILTGNFKYSVLKVGAGLHINISDATDDGYLRLLMYAEKPSFYTNYNLQQPVLSFSSQVVFRGGVTLGFDYAQNYPAGGKAENVITKFTDRDLWRFSFGKTWTVTKSK